MDFKKFHIPKIEKLPLTVDFIPHINVNVTNSCNI